MMEDDMAWCVARTMADVQCDIANRHSVAVHQPAVRFERLSGNAVALAVVIQSSDPETIFLVRPLDRHSQLLGENAGGAAMIDMAVCQQDLFDRRARLADRLAQFRQIA